jgi:rhodanese-related sulfurtransferase
VAGALNVPLGRLPEQINDLPPDREMDAYCRGPWGVLPFGAVARLGKAGFDARRLQDGLPEWRQAGFPVARD